MARSSKHALHTINPVSFGVLAILFLAADIVAMKAFSDPIETMMLVVSGALFGLGLGALVSGRDSGNRLVSSLTLIAYVALLLLAYWIKLVNM